MGVTAGTLQEVPGQALAPLTSALGALRAHGVRWQASAVSSWGQDCKHEDPVKLRRFLAFDSTGLSLDSLDHKLISSNNRK